MVSTRPATHPSHRRVADLVAIAVGAAVFVPAAAIASSGRVGPLEADVFHLVNGMPDVLYPAANVAQFAGVLAIGPIVAVIAVLARRPRLAIAALVVTGLKLLVERAVIWPNIYRARPGTSTPDAIVRGNTPTDGPAFVSGHLILVTALAWVVTPYLRGRWRIAPWIVVGVVGWARMYLGAHNPLDVTGGAAMGLILGGVVNLLVGVPVADGEVDADG
jgi:undecaprenyl-diphosphatase